jgi:DNA polymerase III alpha subunit (gram-positive type)
MPNLLDKKRISFKDRPLLFIDLETTGLDEDIHEIIEIAALIVHQPDLQVVNSYYTKTIPEHIETADPKALKILNYSSKSWQDAIPLKTALTEIAALAPDCILAGWSVQTEWDFLNAATKRLGLSYFYTHRLLEVSALAFVKFRHDPNVNFLNLPTISNKLDVYLDQHKPDSDIRATFEIFKKLIE